MLKPCVAILGSVSLRAVNQRPRDVQCGVGSLILPRQRTASVSNWLGRWLIMLVASTSGVFAWGADAPSQTARPIVIANPSRLAPQPLAATRTPLGVPNDYKPWIVRLRDGQLMIVAFCFGGIPDTKLPPGAPYREHAVFWRSSDGGRTWSEREERPDVRGREFALTCLSDGTLIMPCQIQGNDAENESGYTYSKLFRSTNNGQTWTEQRIGPEGFPEKASTSLDWTPLELPDPDRPGNTMVQLGVAMQHGKDAAASHVFLWRSRDSGLTWDKSLKPDTQGWSDVDGFFSQSTTYRTVTGALLHPVRVDATGPHWKLPAFAEPKQRSGDQDDRSMLWKSDDGGRSWHKHATDGRFGSYGEMYPRFLRLQDGRLLLTFTARSNPTDGFAIGLRALLSYDDGETWDFDHDRLVIGDINIGKSGGGFGNTVQLDDGSLVSVHSYRGQDSKTHVETVRWKL
ncbi:MAG: sialidase family protein [Planctomycetota bacterium]|nr:sialidase family protein [Planctomycetota bacterium]MDA1177553.1 sialidase family protein [Planctomycetota bacterium]